MEQNLILQNVVSVMLQLLYVLICKPCVLCRGCIDITN